MRKIMYIYDKTEQAEDQRLAFSEPSSPFLAILILPRYVHVTNLSVTSATPPPSTGFLDSSACTVPHCRRSVV